MPRKPVFGKMLGKNMQVYALAWCEVDAETSL